VTSKPIERTHGRLADAVAVVRERGASALKHASGAIDATLTRVRNASRTVQTVPDSTLRWLAATSIGLGAGLFLARAPRVVVAAGVAPALVAAAAIVARPDPIATEGPAG
jgi:hypothetical protein